MAYRFEYESTSMGATRTIVLTLRCPFGQDPKESGLTERQKAEVYQGWERARHLDSNWVMRGGMGVNRENVFAVARISGLMSSFVVSSSLELPSPPPPPDLEK